MLLDAAQHDELAQSFEQRNRKTHAEFIAPDEAQRAVLRAERMEKRLRRWLGELNAEQRAALAAWSLALAPTTEAWFAQRLAWQAQLIALLASAHDEAALAEGVKALLLAPDAGWDDDYRAAVEHNRLLTLGLLVSLHELADAQQRQRLVRRVAALAGDFERLACGSGAMAGV